MYTINNYGGNQLLSIIVPIYNTECYLRTCIDSIINQDYKDIEVLLIDDGSTDNSLSICEEYKERDNRIKVFHKNNEGLNLTVAVLKPSCFLAAIPCRFESTTILIGILLFLSIPTICLNN